jgi:sulfotransferase family protein
MSEPPAPDEPAGEAARSSPTDAQPAAAGKPKVIYVMGSGHSGSTILGVALGNCADIFFSGELQNFLARSGEPMFGGLERTRFWASVRSEVPDASELYGTRSLRLLERSLSVFRVREWRQKRRLRPPYRRVTQELYEAIARVAGVTHIVDTSHFPLRARELQQIDGIDLYLIFLVRDPKPVVESIGRMVNRHDSVKRASMLLETNADLWLTHALSLSVFLRQPPERRILVHYEDLVAAPESVLRQILDRSDSTAAIPDLDSLATGLGIHGNRLLSADVVALKREPHAPAQPTTSVSGLLQLPWTRILARLRPAARAQPR